MAAGLLLVTGSATASDVEAELQQMQERIAQLEDQLASETDSLAAEQSTGSSLSSILENTSMEGWAAASYNYNFEGFENGARDGFAALGRAGGGGTTNNVPGSHATSNSVQVDQVWISIDNPADENGRGGAHVDLEGGAVFGAGAALTLFTANASYLAPIGNGVLLTGGLMGTLIGAEVNQQNANFNVTRGQVWSLQPVNVTGVTAGTQLTDEVSVTIGFLNDHLAPGVNDTNNEKVVTGQVAYSGEDMGASFNFNYGDDSSDANLFIGDIVLTYDGIEDVSMWANYTVFSADDDGAANILTSTEGEVHGIAVAARLALADDMGVAVRGEAVITDTDVETETYSLTITGDKSLTDHLTAKAEVRLDFSEDDLYPDDEGAPGEDVAALILAQLLYEF